MSHKITTIEDYSNAESRSRLLSLVSNTLEADDIPGFHLSRFAPYKPNEHDEDFWTVDSGNDWKILFLSDEPHSFILRYRYNAGFPRKEAALAEWLGARLGDAKVEECAP